ncbi:MAG TPA: serine protease [Urbifossiella sp.]|nr:serine protease [Urbifossiella sp.]
MQPDELLIQATCAVYLDGKCAGTGWLLDTDGHVVTAGHIVATPHDAAEVSFGDNTIRIRADHVVHHNDIAAGLDVAVLKVASADLGGRKPLPIRSPRHPCGRFRVYGFGRTLVTRSSGRGEFIGVYEPGDKADYRLFRLDSKQLGEEGFSGGAVFSDDFRAVVAIQSHAATATFGPGRDTVLAMPLYRIAEILRDLNIPALQAENDAAHIELRKKAVACLKPSRVAVERLAAALSRQTPLQLDQLDLQGQCERVVEELISIDVADAVAAMVRTYLEVSKDQVGGTSTEPALSIEDLCYHILPVIYRPEEIRKVRAEVQNGGTLVSFPATYKTTVELLMAGVDGRPVKYVAATDPKAPPPGELLLYDPPEGGLDREGTQAATDFQRHLAAKFLPADGQGQSPAALAASITAVLRNALEWDGFRYYYVYTLPDDPGVRERRTAMVAGLQRTFPTVVFVGLDSAQDPGGEMKILDLLNRLLCRVAGVPWKR